MHEHVKLMHNMSRAIVNDNFFNKTYLNKFLIHEKFDKF